MINKAAAIDYVGRIPLAGNSLRRIARFYREGSVVKIRSGALAGCHWRRSHRYVNGYWLGIYELPIQNCLVRELRPGDVFYDIGANAGFFTLLGSKCVGDQGGVFAFEPLPENISSIRAQLQLNDVPNCTVVEAAVSNRESIVEFSSGNDTSTAHIQSMKQGERAGEVFSVRAVALDQFTEEFPSPDFIKMDIEGAELAALNGARELLGGPRPPKILIEFHSEQLREECVSMLAGFGYSFYSLDGGPLGTKTQTRHALCIPQLKE